MSKTKVSVAICCLLYVWMFPNYTYGQNKIMRGQVQNLTNDVTSVLVVNLNSKKSTITDSLGLFSIEVKLKDTIRFTAVQYVTREIVVTDTIFLKNLLRVYLTEDVIKLNEVTVTPYNLTGQIDLDIGRLGLKPAPTASSLHLPNAEINKLTQHERLLLEADRGKYVYYYGTALVVKTHKIMNRISGRTKSLEEMVARDEAMAKEQEIISKFSKKTIAQGFDISEANIDGFLSYCLHQRDFLEVSRGSTTEVWEYLKTKSVAFKETDSTLVRE